MPKTTKVPLPDKIIRQAISLATLAERPGTPEEGATARSILNRLEAQYGFSAASLMKDRAHEANTRWCVTCYDDVPLSEFRLIRVKGRKPYYLNFCRACEANRRIRFAQFDQMVTEEPDLFQRWMVVRFGIDVGDDQLEWLSDRYWGFGKK